MLVEHNKVTFLCNINKPFYLSRFTFLTFFCTFQRFLTSVPHRGSDIQYRFRGNAVNNIVNYLILRNSESDYHQVH